MTVLTEGRHAGEFLITKGPGTISFDTITVKSGQNLVAGTVFQLDGSSKAVAFTGTVNTAGQLVTEAAGIIWDNVNATAGDVTGKTYVSRLAEVRKSDITVPSDDTAGTKLARAVASLAKKLIITR